MGHLVRERQEAVCGCLVGPINQLGGNGECTCVAVARSQPQQHHVRCRSDASQPDAREVRGVLHSLPGATSGAERPLVLKGLRAPVRTQSADRIACGIMSGGTPAAPACKADVHVGPASSSQCSRWHGLGACRQLLSSACDSSCPQKAWGPSPHTEAASSGRGAKALCHATLACVPSIPTPTLMPWAPACCPANGRIRLNSALD